MDSILEDKLKQLEITYQQLTDKMSDPNILTDYEQIKNIAKSRKEKGRKEHHKQTDAQRSSFTRFLARKGSQGMSVAAK